MAVERFWKTKTLEQMSKSEWESLCDGCALCCLHKLQDDETEEVYYTEIHCRYLDKSNCRCTEYSQRQQLVPHCVWLKPEDVAEFHWLPETCAYRLVAEGKDLNDWHPLISGDPESVHKAGVSLQNKGYSDADIPEEEWEDYIIWKE